MTIMMVRRLLHCRLPLRRGRRPFSSATSASASSSSSTATTFDYIVVGGGSAGCVLANRLSLNPKVKVLLLEAGGDDRYIPFVHLPVGYLWSIGNPSVDWLYKTEPVPGLHGRALAYPRGKVLGGCSSINGMIYMRGQAQDYEGWAQYLDEAEGGEQWAWQNVLTYFKAHEDYAASPMVDRDTHGVGGEWRVEKQRLSWEILDKFRDACEEFGIPKVEDFNRGDNEGSAYFDVNQRRGVRWNTSKAWLHPITAQRPNLTVRTGVHVLKVVLDEAGTMALGVEYVEKGSGQDIRRTAYAGLETVLAAGAVGSPQLLQLSGVGNPASLKAVGILPKHALPGVGENLQDHLQLRMVFRVSNTSTLNEQYASLLGRLQMGLEYLVDRRGPLSMAPSQVGVFCKSDPAQPRANLEYHVQPLSLDKFGEPLHTFSAFTASVCHLQPSSRGTVMLRDADPRSPPIIQPNYLSTLEDKAVAADALQLTRQLVLESKALLPFTPKEHFPGPQYATHTELAHAAGLVGTTIFHPSCTCKMGPSSDPMAVLDAQLRVRGIDKLRVADTSSMPFITSGNTNTPTLMIAEQASAFMHAMHGTTL